MMEESVFYLPAVAGFLTDSYVEARLHTDGEANIANILELQKDLTKSVAVPFYVVVDPRTGKSLGKLAGATDGDTFTKLLENGLIDS